LARIFTIYVSKSLSTLYCKEESPSEKQRSSAEYQFRYPGQIIAMNIMGPFPRSKNGNKYILVVSNYFMWWVESYAIPNQEATTVAVKLIDNMFCRYTIPEQLHSYMGAQFKLKVIQAISKLLGINKTHTTPYHPLRDGLVKRLNQKILSMLATTTQENGKTIWQKPISPVDKHQQVFHHST